MKLCYVIHPYRGATRDAVRLNIQAARCLGLAVARKGYYPVIPQANTAEFDVLDPGIPNELWMAGTRELLRRCDVAVRGGPFPDSDGCMDEIEAALEERIPVWSIDELPPAAESGT